MKTFRLLLLFLMGTLPCAAQEYATREVQLGETKSLLKEGFVDVTQPTSEARLNYMLENVKCYNGNNVTRLTFRGYNPGNEIKRHISVQAVYGYAPSETLVNVFNGDCIIPNGGTIDEHIVLLQMDLQQPVNVKNYKLNFIVTSSGEVTDVPIYFEGSKGQPSVQLEVQSEVAYYDGTVTDLEGKPVANAKINVYRPNFETGIRDFDFAATADAEGHYSVRVEESNCTYNLTVEAESYPIYTVNTPFEVKKNNLGFQPKSISLCNDLEFTANQIATICLPEAPESNWGRYYRMDRREGNTIIFEREETPQANVPYVIFPNIDFSIDISRYDLVRLAEADFSPLSAGEDGKEWEFHGSYGSRDFQVGGLLCRIFDTTPDCCDGQSPNPQRVGACRAYLFASSNAVAQYGTPRFLFVGEQTGISDVEHASQQAGTCFDLQGRRLSGVPQRGMYIRDGRKYVVK